jgi:hypothetical protein
MRPLRPSAGRFAYQIKITLRDSHPPIWRRVLVTGNTSLFKLHQILQIVMEWTDSYRHIFIIDRTFYGKPDPEYHFEVRDEKNFALSQVASGEKNKFTYEYDFTDCWQHELLIEKILPVGKKVQYPVCVGGKRARPPEDCGGIWEYADILEAVQDPYHPDYYNMLKWMEEGFDPESFNLEEINRKLKRIKA